MAESKTYILERRARVDDDKFRFGSPVCINPPRREGREDNGGGGDGVAEGNVGGKAVRGGATNPNKSAQQMRSADFVQRKEMVFDLRFKQVRSQGSVYLPV